MTFRYVIFLILLISFFQLSLSQYIEYEENMVEEQKFYKKTLQNTLITLKNIQSLMTGEKQNQALLNLIMDTDYWIKNYEHKLQQLKIEKMKQTDNQNNSNNNHNIETKNANKNYNINRNYNNPVSINSEMKPIPKLKKKITHIGLFKDRLLTHKNRNFG